MITDTTFTLSHVIQLAAMFFGGLATLLTVWWRIELRIREVETKSKHDLRNAETVALSGRAAIDKDLQNFKLHVSEHYATWSSVKEGEEKLFTYIEKLSDQVRGMPDLVVDRITRYIAMGPK